MRVLTQQEPLPYDRAYDLMIELCDWPNGERRPSLKGVKAIAMLRSSPGFNDNFHIMQWTDRHDMLYIVPRYRQENP